LRHIFQCFNTLDNTFSENSIDLSDAGSASIWALTAEGNDLYVVYGNPDFDDKLTGESTFTIQKAEIPRGLWLSIIDKKFALCQNYNCKTNKSSKIKLISTMISFDLPQILQ
jgi:hypothetical protein